MVSGKYFGLTLQCLRFRFSGLAFYLLRDDSLRKVESAAAGGIVKAG